MKHHNFRKDQAYLYWILRYIRIVVTEGLLVGFFRLVIAGSHGVPLLFRSSEPTLFVDASADSTSNPCNLDRR